MDVFLPSRYATDTSRRYRVLYANDGQNVAGLRLRRALNDLTATAAIQPIIVVAIPSGDRRLMEYGTSGVPNSGGLGADAQKYERFLIDEVIPLITERYRTITGPGESVIMGASLGGLSAFDLAWRHPEIFGAVGVFSGAFWWRTDDSTVARKQASRIMHRRVREDPRHPRLRMWFESGREDETDDRDGNGVIDSIQDTDELMDELVAKGYRRDRDMVHLVVQGRHDVETWSRVLPAFLVWAFSPPAP